MHLTEELTSIGFSLEAVKDDDFDTYFKIEKICYEKYVDEFFGGWDDSVQVKMNTGSFRKMINQTCFQKLLYDGEPAGFLAYDETEDKIDGVAIQMIEKARNKGVGSFFLTTITSLSEKTGKPVFLHVFRSNPAQTLYRRFGFITIGETASHYLMRYM